MDRGGSDASRDRLRRPSSSRVSVLRTFGRRELARLVRGRAKRAPHKWSRRRGCDAIRLVSRRTCRRAGAALRRTLPDRLRRGFVERARAQVCCDGLAHRPSRRRLLAPHGRRRPRVLWPAAIGALARATGAWSRDQGSTRNRADRRLTSQFQVVSGRKRATPITVQL